MKYQLIPTGAFANVIGASVIINEKPDIKQSLNDDFPYIEVIKGGFSYILRAKRKDIDKIEEDLINKLKAIGTIIDETGKVVGFSKDTYFKIKTDTQRCYLNTDDCILLTQKRTHKLLHISSYGENNGVESGIYKIKREAYNQLIERGFVVFKKDDEITGIFVRLLFGIEECDSLAIKTNRICVVNEFACVDCEKEKMHGILLENSRRYPYINIMTIKSYNLQERLLVLREAGLEL